MKTPPNKSPEPTAVGAVSSAIAVHVASRRWLSFLRWPPEKPKGLPSQSPGVGARHVSPPKLRAKEGAPNLGTCSGRIINPSGVVPRHGTGPRDTTPTGLGAWGRFTQGSSGCAVATLGFETESRWDSRSRHQTHTRSTANDVAPADGGSPRRSFCGPPPLMLAVPQPPSRASPTEAPEGRPDCSPGQSDVGAPPWVTHPKMYPSLFPGLPRRLGRRGKPGKREVGGPRPRHPYPD
jgi:hypothetical protein